MGIHYEDGASQRRHCGPLSAKASYGLGLEMKCPPDFRTLPVLIVPFPANRVRVRANRKLKIEIIGNYLRILPVISTCETVKQV